MADPIPAPVLPQTPGLLNSGPGLATTTPGTSPTGSASGAPVTGYNPAAATAAVADSTGYTAKPFEVSDNAKVASQLKEITDSGSPLMQRAEARARNLMNSRGLLNSDAAITAGESAVIDAATPIATADAATFDRAATNTTAAANTAAQFTAGAKNTALLQNAAAGTSTNQFNAGQENAALKDAATASNAVSLTAQQITGTKDVAELQSLTSKELARINGDTSLSVADKQAASQKVLADIQANTTLSGIDKQIASQQVIAGMQANTTQQVAQLQADTTLSAQDKAAAATQSLAVLNNTFAKQIADLQASTQLSMADKSAAIQKLVASMNNDTAKQVQQLQNAGSLANIKANGEISTRLQILGDNSRQLLQTNAGASQLYTQALTNMSAVMVNPDLNPEQKTAALNNQVQMLTDGLQTFAAISGTPGVSSLVSFSTQGNQEGGGSPQATPVPVLPNATPAQQNVAAQATPAIQNIYATVLGRSADPAGLAYWAQQAANGMPVAQIQASIQASDEYKALHPAV